MPVCSARPLDADEVRGQVLTPKMSGTVSVYHLRRTGPKFLVTSELAADGEFTISAPQPRGTGDEGRADGHPSGRLQGTRC